MQIFFIPEILAIFLCFILWPIFQALGAYVSHKIPDRFLSYSLFLYRAHRWEKNGEIYKQIFKVDKWKTYLPESSSLIKGSYNKKKIDNFSKDSLDKFLLESCRAEMTHWLGILPFWIFGLFTPARVVGYMFIYAMAVNLPCIIVQRYNRPRIIKLLAKLKKVIII